MSATTPPGELIRRHAGHVLTFQAYRTAGRAVQAGNHVEQGRFSGTVRADDGEDFAS